MGVFPRFVLFLSMLSRVMLCGVMLLGVPAARAQGTALLDILEQELQRNYQVLKEKASPAPYYLSYTATEEETYTTSATLGALQNSGGGKSRYLDVTLRLGSPKLDNYHRNRGDRVHFTSGAALPLEDSAPAIQRRLWIETDRVYRAASQRLTRLESDKQVKVAEEDGSDDFSPAEAARAKEPPPPLKFALPEFEAKARKWSAELGKFRGVLASNVTVQAQRETKYMVSTEGTRLEHGRNFVRIMIVAQGKASDGMDLVTTDTVEAPDPSKLPKDDEVLAAVKRVGNELTGLLNAPSVDPYVGPAILSGRAAGVFFHEIFGHRIEGHRQKDETEGQTFTKMVDKPVLPDFLSVIFDPTRRTWEAEELNGWYLYDDEGVKAQRVTVVDKGVLKTFLLSRSPIKGFPKSNGHGRRQPGAEVVSRQSNLIVESTKKVPESQLRALLVEEIKKQNKQYGLYFKEVTGGFTTTGRQGLQAFTVMPLVVYRVYADGRPDELVRGVDIVGTPLASFGKILATSDKTAVFNGICGAESGSVPVSAISPALLVAEIEVQRKQKSQDSPPYLPRPTGGGQ